MHAVKMQRASRGLDSYTMSRTSTTQVVLNAARDGGRGTPYIRRMTSDDTSSITKALYSAISGVAGAPRDWALHDSLFAAGACSYVLHRNADGTCEAEVLTQEQYRTTRQPHFDANDFFEVETAHQATVSGDFALVLSEYDSRHSPDGPAFDSGVNALMMVKLGGHWRITSISWHAGSIATTLREARQWGQTRLND